MSVAYQLRKNNLVDTGDVYAAGVEIAGSVELEEIADRIIEQGSTVTRPDVLAVLENSVTAIESYLLDGFRVQFAGLCDLFPRIKGKFEGLTDSYDPARHQVDIAAVPGNRIRKNFKTYASVEKRETVKPVPSLTQYYDLGSGKYNTEVTPNNIGQINGYRLKFDPAQADEGIFFIRTDGSAEVKVSDISNNTASRQVFLIPSTLAGATEYYLEVRTRYTAEGELRIGRLDGVLEIA